MEQFGKIAIIGMSGRFPLADTLDDLDRIFSEKIDCIHPLGEKRKSLLNLDKSKKYFDTAYLDDVEYFDYDFFQISKHEAAVMDPQQRIVLELACEAIEDAGYSLKDMRQSNTAFVLGAHNSHFADDYLADNSGFAGIGNFNDAMSGRVSYYLDLRGQASIVQTACSSSLYAIYEACVRLNAKEADTALAGGICLEFRAKYDTFAKYDNLGILSPNGKCYTFDERADGINLGEGAGLLLLKRYEDAIRDGDPIHGVIASVAANQDGGRSNSMAAPSAEAQGEVIAAALAKAGLKPEEIGYFEAHGTGTKIGDPIEILGISLAYNKYGSKKQFCPIGSLKTNLTHLGTTAGVAGVIKGIISFRNNKKYPLQQLENQNPLIDFENSPVYPIKELETWDTDKQKRMGISAFGVSGTNVHLILEEFKSDKPPVDANADYLLGISAKSPEALNEYKNRLIHEIDKHSLSDLCFTMNTGRNDYEWRSCYHVTNKEDLKNQLLSGHKGRRCDDKDLVILISDGFQISDEQLSSLQNENRVFNEVYNKLSGSVVDGGIKKKMFCVYVAMFEQWKAMGIQTGKILGSGVGRAVIDYLSAQINLSEALNYADTDHPFNESNFNSYVSSLKKDGDNYVFLELGSAGQMSEICKNAGFQDVFCTINNQETIPLLDVLAQLYTAGATIDWKQFHSGRGGRKIHTVTYPFAKTKAWPKVVRSQAAVQEMSSPQQKQESLKDFLINLWAKELEVAELGEEDDFFELGANSLMTINIINQIQTRTGIELDFDSFYDYSTINMLYDHLMERIAEEEPLQAKKEIAIALEQKENDELSHNQRRMLFLMETMEEPAAYNIPLLFKINGTLNSTAFISSVEEIVRRHEILHTTYQKTEGQYCQVILSDYDFNTQYADRTGEDPAIALNRESEIFSKAFNLFGELPIRSKLVKTGEKEYYWLVSIHHIAADGSSLEVIGYELNQIYQKMSVNAESNSLPHLSIQYSDYAVWEKEFLESEKATKQINFWKEELSGIKGIIKFPVDHQRPVKPTCNGASMEFELEEELCNKCREFIKQENLTLFMFLETVYAAELYLYTRETDICIGVPVANRIIPEWKKLIGFFANTIAVRNRIQPSSSFKDVLRINKEHIARCFLNINVPFEQVVKEIDFIRDKAFTPLVQYFFALQNFTRNKMTLDGSEMELINVDQNTAMFEMTMMMYETGSNIKGLIEYNTDLFNRETIGQFIQTYKSILTQVLEHPDQPLDRISAVKESVVAGTGEAEDYLF